MATVKNFGLEGVASEVQLGKAGPSFKADSGNVEVRGTLGDLTNVKAANAVALDDLVTLAQLQAVQEGQVSDGFAIILGDVTTDGDGSWSPGAVPLTNTTKVSDAVDQLNEILAKLVPAAPANFPNATLSITNGANANSPRLASGSVPDNTSGGHGWSASSTVFRVAAATVSTSGVNDVGPGDTGTVQWLLNDTVIGSRVLTGSDNGTYSGLVISDSKDFPVSTPGFWKSFDAVITNGAVANSGINKVEMYHTGAAAGTNEVFFVRDTLTSGSVISGASIAENAQGTLSYSSSVPHYGSGASLTANFSLSNLAGETYFGGTNPVTVTGTNSIIGSQTFTYANMGISTPIARNTTAATAVTPITINLNASNIFNSGTIQGATQNVHTTVAAANLSATNVLVMAGTAASGRFYEMNIPVSVGTGSGNGVRVATGSGDKPAAAVTAWNSSDALQTYDAAVVAGALSHNQINYSTGYLPVGPNLSVGRSGAQYFTFSFNRSAVSKFKITVTATGGAYNGMWVKLPGVSDNSSIAFEAATNHNGWWNAYQLYDGSGVPGEAGDPNAGCALGTIANGGNGTTEITFGTQSSTNATGNQILVRIRLAAGQSLTGISITA